MTAEKLQPKVGPFFSEQSGIFLNFSSKIRERIDELKLLAADLANYEVRIHHVVFNKHYKVLKKKYGLLFKEFVDLYGISKKPLLEGLLKDLNLSFPHDEKKITELSLDYRKIKGDFERNFEEGFRFIEMIDRQIENRSQTMDQNRTFLISLLAIIVSIYLK